MFSKLDMNKGAPSIAPTIVEAIIKSCPAKSVARIVAMLEISAISVMELPDPFDGNLRLK